MSTDCGIYLCSILIIVLKRERERESLLFESSGNIDIYMSLNNSKFGYFVYCIYPIEFEIKDTTDTARSVSYLDLRPEIDSDDWLRTKLCNRRDDFNFPIVNFPFIYSNIPSASTYGVCSSPLIRYSRVCGSYQDFLDIWFC
jgi:hypothetical protein